MVEEYLEQLQNTPQLPTTSFTCRMLCRMRHNTIDTFVIQQNGNKLQGVLQFSRIFSFVGSLMTLAHNLFLVGFTFGENDMFWSPTLLSSTSSLSPDPVNSGMFT